jgi:hypothetical protein
MRPSSTGPLTLNERQLATAFGALAEAVTVQAADGRRRFANGAALALLGFATLQEYLVAEPNAIASRFRRFRADGSPMGVDELPGRRILRGERPGALTYRWVDLESGRLQWLRMRSTALTDDAGALAGVVNIIEDVTASTDSDLSWRLLDDYARTLASSLDYEETLQHVAQLAVPRLADWCAVDVLDARGTLTLAGIAHADPERVAFARELRRRYPHDVARGQGLAQVIREGVTSRMRGIADATLVAAAHDAEHLALLRELRLHEVLIVPLQNTAGATIGALTFVLSGEGRRFTDGDVRLAEELGRRAGAAVHNAWLYTERGEIAHVLQASMLPGRLTEPDGWRVALHHRAAGAANEVGGDLYDVVDIGDDRALVLIGDVIGKGAGAAALTPRVRHTLIAATALTGDPRAGMELLDRALAAEQDSDHAGATAATVVLSQERGGTAGQARIVSAGHPQPVLVRGGRVLPVGTPGPMLGLPELPGLRPHEDFELRAGDALVLYTDGVTEAVGAEGGERLGLEPVIAALEAAGESPDAEALVAAVRDAVEAFTGGRPSDDVVVLAVQRTR